MRKPACYEKQDTNKGAWSKQEDQKLIDYINTHGQGCWRNIPLAAGLLRCGKSCRLRWRNYLRPDLKRGNFTEDEEDLIIRLHALLGNRWSLIAGRLPGRTDNEVKNYWNTHLRRKLVRVGIDPNNHRLNQKIQSHPQNPNASDGANSYSLKSNTQTFLEAEEARGLPDLNLDLKISISPPSNSIVEEERKENESQMGREDELVSSPTLILFR